VKKHSWIAYLGGAALLAALAWWARGHVHFQWDVFRDQLHFLDWKRIAIGIALIWLCYGLRAVRWALLLKPQKKVSAFSLFGSQLIGFTAVALFGRLADLVRPYLVARRTQLPLVSQIAVYTVERMLDLAAMALVFSSALLLAPDRATVPHHQAFQRTALAWLALAIALGFFAVAVRASGKTLARVAERTMGALSPKLGQSVGQKILTFRDGLDVIQSWRDFLYALAISLVMWGMITVAFLETMRAFVLSPQLSSMTVAGCMVLMAASMAGSTVTLPVIGWGTQIVVIMGAMQTLFHVRPEPALGCAAMLLIISFLTVIPVGLLWSRIEHLSLREVARESEDLAVEKNEAAAAAISEA
jgi:glycosyltransferase 2 family protein